jgi:ectoine hydroxylase-related dioxygenase (phytanoyl-CoA dioxygenase family)
MLGLAIIPGSHHSTFPYPNSNGSGSGVGYSLSDKEVLTVECNAGDLVIMPLRTVHAAHVWKPIDRDRRMIFYTFAPQDVFADEGGSVDDTLAQCAAAGVELDIDPLTQELMATKKKGLSQQLKPLVASMIDEGQLNQAVDRANSWE